MEQPNLNYIKELSGGDKSFEDKFIGILKSEFPLEKSEYEKLLAGQELGEAAELVHKIKHKLGVLGLYQGYEIAVQHEEALNKGNVSLVGEFEALLCKIEEFINNIAL